MSQIDGTQVEQYYHIVDYNDGLFVNKNIDKIKTQSYFSALFQNYSAPLSGVKAQGGSEGLNRLKHVIARIGGAILTGGVSEFGFLGWALYKTRKEDSFFSPYGEGQGEFSTRVVGRRGSVEGSKVSSIYSTTEGSSKEQAQERAQEPDQESDHHTTQTKKENSSDSAPQTPRVEVKDVKPVEKKAISVISEENKEVFYRVCFADQIEDNDLKEEALTELGKAEKSPQEQAIFLELKARNTTKVQDTIKKYINEDDYKDFVLQEIPRLFESKRNIVEAAYNRKQKETGLNTSDTQNAKEMQQKTIEQESGRVIEYSMRLMQYAKKKGCDTTELYESFVRSIINARFNYEDKREFYKKFGLKKVDSQYQVGDDLESKEKWKEFVDLFSKDLLLGYTIFYKNDKLIEVFKDVLFEEVLKKIKKEETPSFVENTFHGVMVNDSVLDKIKRLQYFNPNMFNPNIKFSVYGKEIAIEGFSNQEFESEIKSKVFSGSKDVKVKVFAFLGVEINDSGVVQVSISRVDVNNQKNEGYEFEQPESVEQIKAFMSKVEPKDFNAMDDNTSVRLHLVDGTFVVKQK